MKAKEYASKLKADPTKEMLREICADFLNEVWEFCDQHRNSPNETVCGILDRQREKWLAFYRLTRCKVPDIEIHEDGFEKVIKYTVPEVYITWKRYNRRIGR